MAVPVLRHRVLLNFQAEADGVSTDDIVAQVFDETTLAGLGGNLAIGHVRYSTTGSNR